MGCGDGHGEDLEVMSCSTAEVWWWGRNRGGGGVVVEQEGGKNDLHFTFPSTLFVPSCHFESIIYT